MVIIVAVEQCQSLTVKGMAPSIMVQTISTKGTPRTAHLNSSGAWLILAPIRSPPALRPSHES